MAIKKTTSYGILSNRDASAGNSKIVDIPDAPTIGTATAGIESATVTYTASLTGGTGTTFTALSNPGSITATGSSPITVSGLTASTAYTFTIKAGNTTGDSAYSSASNSITTLSSPAAYESIATVLVGPAGASNISFTSIPSTYKHLQLRMYNRTNRSYNGNTVDAVNIKLDGNLYTKLHRLAGDGSAAYSGVATDGFYTAQNGSSGTTNPGWGAQVFDLLDYSNTNKNKVGRLIGGFDPSIGGGYVQLSSWLWATTTTPTSIDIYSVTDSSFYQYSSFALYGIRG
jgi:hypothetical protein